MSGNCNYSVGAVDMKPLTYSAVHGPGRTSTSNTVSEIKGPNSRRGQTPEEANTPTESTKFSSQCPWVQTITTLASHAGPSYSSPDKMSYAFSRYRQYLRSYYKKSPIVHDDMLSIAPCNTFIQLALVNTCKNIKSNDLFSLATLHGGVDEIEERKTPLEMDDIVTRDSRFILVEGPPGHW